ncbi:MAG: hypothetical protein ACE5GC_03195 [Acidimicrobiia bacterium]
MLTRIPPTHVRRGVSISIGLAVLWVVVALLRSGTTFHLAPLLVAGALPVVVAFDLEDRISAQHLVLPTVIGLAGALAATALLTLVDEMQGPSLLPFGGAVTEAVLFSVAGAVGGLVIGALRRP